MYHGAFKVVPRTLFCGIWILSIVEKTASPNISVTYVMSGTSKIFADDYEIMTTIKNCMVPYIRYTLSTEKLSEVRQSV